jgi:hypothetical protein
MGRRRGRPAATAIALGVAIGVVLALVVRTIALGDGPRVAESTVNAVALGVAVAALALSFVARRVGRRAPAWLAVAGGTLASLAVAVWLGLGNDVVRFHTWEHFHYYLGAKYFRELSYSRLYACTAVVEAERVGLEEMEGRRMRDLATDEVVSVDGALAQPDECKRRFTPERWRAFGDDVMFFRGAMGGMWDRMQQDHGYNPPPTWALAGGVLASIAPAGVGTQTALGLIDPLLLATMLGLVGWAFGAHVLFVAIVVWACQLPGAATWTSAAFLRQDWLLCLVASVCFARRGWPALAGLAIASSAALRVFPALLLVLPLVVIARRTWRHGRLAGFDARFLAGVAGGAAAWFGVSVLAYGVDSWRAFAEHLAVHRLAPLANHVGLRAVFSQSWDGRWMAAMRPGTTDPFAVWAASRRETFAAMHGAYLAVAACIVAVTLAGGWRLRRVWTALAASSVLVVTAVDLASYYCAFFIVLGLLAAVSRTQERLALGAIVVGRVVNMLPIATENPDYRYVVQGAVFVAWGLAAVVLLAWRPRFGPVATVPAVSRATRRRGGR